MKIKLFFFLFLWSSSSGFAQIIEWDTLLKDNISIRALQIEGGKVWYVGTDSKLGYITLNNPEDHEQILLGDKKLQFRTLAQDRSHLYTISIASPACFYKINKNTLDVKLIHQDRSTNAFYDTLHYEDEKFYTFSDPEKDLKLKLFRFTPDPFFKISSAVKTDVFVKDGEAAFAASNTNMASTKRYLWMATGGTHSRIIKINLCSQQTKVFDTPFVQGTASEGIYSIDFYNNRRGIAVGGDYTKQSENRNNIATTRDGGKTWQVQASGKNGGYKTCVKYRPKSGGKDIIAVGDQNIEFSSDYGKTWKIISEQKGLYVCDWIDQYTIVFAGQNRILKMTLNLEVKK